MFVRYPPGKIRYQDDRPVALLGVRVAASRFRLVDLPLGMPTTSARTGRGTWALYPLGAEVVVVHPDGAVSGPPVEVAAEVGRLAAHDRQGELDRQAAQTIQHLLLGDDVDPAGPRRLGTRSWSAPAKAYWISGPYNHHGHSAAQTAGPSRWRRGPGPRDAGSHLHAASPASTQPALGQPGPRAREQHASNPIRSPPHRRARLTRGQPRRRGDMRIMATCSTCHRDLLLSQLVEGPGITGRCPWCGTLLAPHYTLLLTDTVQRAERAAAELVRALERLGGDWARLHIRAESLLDPIRAQLVGAEAALSRPGLRRAT
jgi:hypothetical protein